LERRGLRLGLSGRFGDGRDAARQLAAAPWLGRGLQKWRPNMEGGQQRVALALPGATLWRKRIPLFRGREALFAKILSRPE